MVSDECAGAVPFHALPAGHPRTLQHLLTCPPCRDAALRELLPEGPAPRPAERRAPEAADRPPAPLGALAALDAVETPASVAHLIDTLELLPAKDLTSRLMDRRYARPEVLDALLARGEGCLRTEPYRSEHLGLVGLFLAGRIDDDESWVPPGVARAGVLVGGARRLQGKLKEADRALHQVSAFLSTPREEADFARELALLRWQEGRSCEAAALLAHAADRSQESGETEPAAVAWALLGLLRREEPTLEGMARAWVPLQLAAESLDSRARPSLALRVRLALVLCVAERGDPRQARAFLEAARPLVHEAESTLAVTTPSLAYRWTEGRLLGLEDRPKEATQRLLEVRSTKMAIGDLGDATLASLDLARVAAEQGDFDRSETLADELAYRFQGQDGIVFALQALADFEESVLANPERAGDAHALASRFLRQSFRAKGLRVEMVGWV